MANHVQSVDNWGIEYTDDNGNVQFIDFNVCYGNYLERHYRTRSTNDDIDFEGRVRKCIGQRDLYSNPPYIELFTNPPTRFEFPLKEGFYELRRKIDRANWRTIDLG